MTLKELHDRFYAGGMDMATYVAAMQALHVQLLDYAELLPGSDICRIEITDGRVVLTSRSTGLKFRYADRQDRYSVLTPLNTGPYEAEYSGALFRFAAALAGTEPFTFLDIGANGGWYALNMAQRFPACTVHAFEPVAATFQAMALNVELNGFTTIHLHHLGLMDEDGAQTFFFDPTISGRASARNLVDDPAALPVSCPVTRMDTFCRTHGVAPAVLKVDVEGAELMVFRGGLETLAAHKPLVMAELLRKWSRKFGYHPNDVLALMANLGYRCYFLEAGRLVELATMTEEVEATNFFFLHQEKHKALL